LGGSAGCVWHGFSVLSSKAGGCVGLGCCVGLEVLCGFGEWCWVLTLCVPPPTPSTMVQKSTGLVAYPNKVKKIVI